jgi:FKBP-type peptidyl-prolyl cis-trans isomerase FklB
VALGLRGYFSSGARFLPLTHINAKIMDMRKLLFTAAGTLTVGFLMLGTTAAQTTPASTPKPATAAKTGTTAKTSSTTKPHTATTSSQAPLTLKTEKEKLSYAIGLNIGESMKKDSLDIDPAVLSRAIKDAMTGGKPAMSETEAKAIITAFRSEMMKQQQAKAVAASDANKVAGEKFLAENKSKPGVVTLPSGLQYKIIKEGDGPKPTASDTVVTNYRGTLIDGTEFDSSYKRGEPATFPVGQVIKGWTEALQLMPVGSKWQLYIPANLAYGERSPGAEIGPNSTLIFDIELLSIQDKKPAEQQ